MRDRSRVSLLRSRYWSVASIVSLIRLAHYKSVRNDVVTDN